MRGGDAVACHDVIRPVTAVRANPTFEPARLAAGRRYGLDRSHPLSTIDGMTSRVTEAPDSQVSTHSTSQSTRPGAGRACGDCGKPANGKYAKWCDACRWRHRGKPQRWTQEKDDHLRRRYDPTVRGRAAAIARTLGFPRWAVTRRASFLGLSRPWPKDRKDWTREEVAFLEEHAGTRHANWIRRRLGRSLTSVVVKMKRLGLSRRVTEGYTMRALEQAFGTDHKTIYVWIEKGWLKASGLPEEGEPIERRRTMNVTEVSVKRFVREHWDAIDIRRVDQTWLGDILFNRGAL